MAWLKSLSFPPQIKMQPKKLFDACVPSSHGHGEETVYDESYRLARELPQGKFALTTEILSASGILASILSLTSPRNPSEGLVAHLYKLNAYTTGGFFKPHRDTPKSDCHLGTMVVALPVPFEGGALRVSHEGKDFLFNWDTTVSENKDVEHEALPVTSGIRVTLAYDIFTSEAFSSPTTQAVDGTYIPFYHDLKATLSNNSFLPQGGRIAIALSREYPMNLNSPSDSFASHLKGSDAALHHALSALGVKVESHVVYWPEDSYEVHEGQLPDDEFVPRLNELEVLYTSNEPVCLPYIQCDVSETEMLQKCNARLEADIIWACKPSTATPTGRGYYVHYANEATLAAISLGRSQNLLVEQMVKQPHNK
ncbi:hypothetical protein K439DRAFT_1614126 [Ramaria rubella]|nr:hypothetical protein K439DRAFT_1614126 [Ramaria rubella]